MLKTLQSFSMVFLMTIYSPLSHGLSITANQPVQKQTTFSVTPYSVTSELQEAITKAQTYLAHSTGGDPSPLQSALELAMSLTSDSSDSEKEAALQTLRESMQTFVLEAEPTDGIAFDLTFLIQNPSFSSSDEGWSIAPTVNFGEAEIFNKTFNLYQTLKEMRCGLYRLNVTGFHRNGNYQPGIEQEGNAGCAIYGNQTEQPLLSLYYDEEAKQFNQTGGYANSMQEAQQIFDKGFYSDNQVVFEQEEDGNMVIGLKNNNSRNANWTCFRNFTLEYLGKNTGGRIVGTFRISSPQMSNTGSWTPGELAGETTPVYHTTSLLPGKSGYWILKEEKKKQYSLCNAENGLYLTWDGQYVTEGYLRRYVDLTSELKGDSSLWTITTLSDGNCIIRNVFRPEHLADLRSPSHIIGTYENGGNAAGNQLFQFYTPTGQLTTNFNGESVRKALLQFELNSKEPAYNMTDGTYLHPLSEELFRSGTATIQIQYELKEGYTELFIEDTPVSSGSTFTFKEISGDRNYKIGIKNTDGEITETQLSFTALPIVQIYGSFGDDYSEGSIRVNEPEIVGADTIIDAKIRWRGASTRYRMKKQYAIKLYDKEGESKDASFFGLRDDNNWILDGMSIDKARMRNRVVTDLWNYMAEKPYYFDDEPEAKTGTRGHFVEAFLNDEYVGIYCMTEKMDRKQMKLKKIDEDTPEAPIRGELWKSSDWSYSVFMGHYYDQNTYPMTPPPSFDNSSETWDGYEVKHPDLGDGEPVDWQDLYDAVNFVATAPDETFSSQVGDYFDIPVLVDYYILMEAILSADNHGKNMYFGIYNRKKSKKMTFAVWDLDSTCGRRWDSSEIDPSQDYTEYISANEHGDYNLFRRMKMLNAEAFNERVRTRYAELRQTALHTDSIVNRFTTYKDLFELSGAASREEKRWNNTDAGTLDFDDEMNYLRNWFTTRMEFIDSQLCPNDISNTVLQSNLEVYGCENSLIIKCSAPEYIRVYSSTGTLLLTKQIEPGTTKIPNLAKGLYIINHQKAIVR